jgi:hypothetical protein
MKRPAKTPKRFTGVRPPKSVTTPKSIKPVGISFVKKNKKA